MPKFKVTISLEPYVVEVEAPDKETARDNAEDMYCAYLEGVKADECIEIEEIK